MEGETERRVYGPVLLTSSFCPPPRQPFQSYSHPSFTPSIHLSHYRSDAVANSLCALLPETQTGQGLCTGDASRPYFQWDTQIVCQIVQRRWMKD